MPSGKRKFTGSYVPSGGKRTKTRFRQRSFVTIPRNISGGTRVSYGSIVRSLNIDYSVIQGITQGYGFSFSSGGVTSTTGGLTNWSGSTDISNAFDAYRLKAVYMRVLFNQNQSAISVLTSTLPYLLIANDYDDITYVTTSDIIQRDGFKEYVMCGDTCTWKCVPKVAAAAYGSTAVSAYMEPKAMQWVSTGAIAAATDAQHYGIKTLIDATKMSGTVASIGNVRFVFTAYFDLKHAQ